MRILIKNYGDCRVFSDRPFGYKRYHVEWNDGHKQVYSGLWYKEQDVLDIVEQNLPRT
jgi:hypothetical protein|tara:strand:+ start:39 stop:212 length:174 start_codon:yes stop_codon:yes gene_type:complete